MRAAGGCGCSGVAKLPAHDLSIGDIPVIVGHRAPRARVEDLDSALARGRAAHKTHEALDLELAPGTRCATGNPSYDTSQGGCHGLVLPTPPEEGPKIVVFSDGSWTPIFTAPDPQMAPKSIKNR